MTQTKLQTTIVLAMWLVIEASAAGADPAYDSNSTVTLKRSSFGLYAVPPEETPVAQYKKRPTFVQLPSADTTSEQDTREYAASDKSFPSDNEKSLKRKAAAAATSTKRSINQTALSSTPAEEKAAVADEPKLLPANPEAHAAPASPVRQTSPSSTTVSKPTPPSASSGGRRNSASASSASNTARRAGTNR